MRVKVMWHDKDKGPGSWETRGDVKQYMYAKKPHPGECFTKESVNWGKMPIIQKGE